MTTNNGNNNFSALTEQQLQLLSSAASSLNSNQLIWASGFLAGLAGAANALPIPASSQTTEQASLQPTLTILYGSQTGNSKGVANSYKASALEQGYKANVVSMSDYKPRQLKNETHLVVIVSTHGEGDAPDDAVELYEFLASKKAPKLPNLKFAVVGLGDTSYEFFCQTGKDFESRLLALGATALVERLDCDVDYESVVADWTVSLNAKLKDELKPVVTEQVINLTPAANAVAESLYNKKNPFAASLSESLKITARDSVKDIRHIEVSLEGSGIVYKPGDALGVWFSNDEAMVQRILAATSTNAEDKVLIAETEFTLLDALLNKLELTLSYPGFVKKYQAQTAHQELAELMEDKAALREYLSVSQIVDITEKFPAKISAQELVDALRPITPRLYSIASSQAEVEDEVHLTVAHIEYEANGFTHQGGASGFLSTRLKEGDKLNVYVENNDNFRLPSDPNTPIIMIGPGTGIAPFRAFMQERDAVEAEGKNWLFFGNPNFTQDFLYQTEWQGYLKSGLLSKISLAFSRDQANKIYVQDRLKENGKEVFDWLEQGAHFYICGDALRMAKDVETTLLDLVAEHGNKTTAEAKEYVTNLRKSKRYQKDVY
ncbi:assimilatory sulfite reductase (NADPH) flavoprotein subunit [Brumicola nitratireducens]|uniref:Sulfite reductase [NADPH] flavoprotein alpha-component n=1 Tax=Glaciecola nitratireducens (strain JCM 12485 / KCTC 12276 / FR1064) TaxID=1085623 RepID=G4QJS1_GLANF|nr:assimilatory sulfite reductase (NADPH) flavoprotein subunit [Glaciecola nitratireducens]AEP28963.1 sulfite reductase, alpha subunit [Glaciecola nitratireducens FR1064]